jgi:response regulator RpfG family c-di-GMP phosphodiesterase
VKVVVLDDSKKRKELVTNLLEEKGYDVVACLATGEFMETIETTSPDTVLVDVESWQRGKPLLNYFKFSRKLSEIPVFFYNAPENFIGISDRAQHQHDKFFTRHVPLDEVISNI